MGKAPSILVGNMYHTNNSGVVEVVHYESAHKITVKFVDTCYSTVVNSKNLTDGTVKDWTLPNTFGVGIMDIKGENKRNTMTKEYSLWASMLSRCYSQKFLSRKPSYLGCEVSTYFKTFSNFKNWCNKQIGFKNIDEKGIVFALDKDILIKGNKLYSEDTCCFVPQEINAVFGTNKRVRGKYPIGVVKYGKCGKFSWRMKVGDEVVSRNGYKTPEDAFYEYKILKEERLRVLAEKYREQIDVRVYEALMNWKIEITD